jgi:hypothetical protein
MQKNHQKLNRRDFLKTVGIAGAGSVLASTAAKGAIDEPNETAGKKELLLEQVPRRKLGKTGVEVPCLAMGLMSSLLDNQILLRKSLDFGVNYWDTSNGYAGGNSERGIGKFFGNNPTVRKNVFLVTKASGAMTVAEVEKRLSTSFERMNTDYIDLYCGVHGLSSASQLTDELRRWAEDAKKKGKIRFFGFSMHENMAENLTAASKLDWIDAIMTSYNFRFMLKPELDLAVEACHKAGIGLIAMKTQGKAVWEIKTEADKWVLTEAEKRLTEHLLKQGFSLAQANIKIVGDKPWFSAVCVGMNDVAVLRENVAVSLNKTKLTDADLAAFRQYAEATCSGYCAGCSNICKEILPDMPYVSEIMRYLMYHNGYGDRNRARALFAHIPENVRANLLNIDYSTAEARCPQRMPIGKFMAEAAKKLA